MIYTPDLLNVGDIYTTAEVEDKSIFGSEKRQATIKSSVVYTDYTDIVAIFACYETKMNLMTEANRAFTILVRDRSFNSLTKFGMALGALVEKGVDINDLRFMYNGPNCKN